MIVAIAAGLLLGVASKLVDYVAPAWAGNSLALWLLVAFLVGWRAGGWREAALWGCLALVVANCAYYALRLFVIDNVSVRFAIRAFTFWTILAVPAGVVAGTLALRRREGLALAAGAFAAEAVYAAAVGGRSGHVAAAAVVAVGLAAMTSWTRAAGSVAVGAATAVVVATAVRRAVLA